MGSKERSKILGEYEMISKENMVKVFDIFSNEKNKFFSQEEVTLRSGILNEEVVEIIVGFLEMGLIYERRPNSFGYLG